MEQSRSLLECDYHFERDTSRRRRALFPSNSDDSDSDLGHMSPLSNDTNFLTEVEVHTNPTSSGEDEYYFTALSTSNMDDYIILENLPKTTYVDVSTPNTKFPNKEMSPLRLSPLDCGLDYSDADISMNTILQDTPLRNSSIDEQTTPHDTSGASSTIPKLVRKSLSDHYSKSSENMKRKALVPLSPSNSKIPKLDTSLNKTCKVRTALFPEVSLGSGSFYPTKTSPISHSAKSRRSNSSKVYLCNRQRNRKAGQINAGVRHKIKRPKFKKLNKAQILNEAANILDNSPLNDFFEQIPKAPIAAKIVATYTEKPVEETVREPSPPPDPSKKFFRSKRASGVVSIGKNIKIKVDKGKMSLLEKQTSKKRKRTDNFNFDMSDLMLPDNEDVLSNDTIESIISTLDDNKENQAKTLQPHLLLSPTSQMCDMTSGLAINSPKKAKQNVTAILEGMPDKVEDAKLFPIFYSNPAPAIPKMKETSPKQKKWKRLSKGQMLLDAGQSSLGMTQCLQCEAIYFKGDPGDEIMHQNYHCAINVLRFNGWKNERVVFEGQDHKVIKVLPTDSPVWWKKTKELLDVVNRDLGFFEMPLTFDNNSQVFIYIKKKKICGCLVAESVSEAYRMLSPMTGVDLCSEMSYPVKCGVSRIWVEKQYRRQGVASTLLNCLRINFVHGAILSPEDMAFSSPTEMGKLFATKFFNTSNYLVY